MDKIIQPKRRYWLRGLVILGIFGLIVTSINLYASVQRNINPNIFYKITFPFLTISSPIAVLLGFIDGFLIRSQNAVLIVMNINHFIAYCIYGIIIGWIYGLIKSKLNK